MWWQRQREKLTFKRDSPLLWKNTREKALRFDWAVRERLKDQTHEDDKHRERDTHTEYILRYWKWDAPRERHFKERKQNVTARTLRCGVLFASGRARGIQQAAGIGLSLWRFHDGRHEDLLTGRWHGRRHMILSFKMSRWQREREREIINDTITSDFLKL